MSLPGTNQPISLSQVNTELGLTSTAQISLNDAAVRNLFGKASGAISFADGWGKTNAWLGTITTNQASLNLRTWAINAGWGGNTAAAITLAANTYIYSGSTSSIALVIDGSWPGGINFINNGFVLGMGGAGGAGGVYTADYYVATPASFNGSAGLPGGTAISLGVNCTITNNGTISGGGGGGGGGAIVQYGSY